MLPDRRLLESLDLAESFKAFGANLLAEMEAQLAAEKRNLDWVVRKRLGRATD